jgi:hypothetical protein
VSRFFLSINAGRGGRGGRGGRTPLLSLTQSDNTRSSLMMSVYFADIIIAAGNGLVKVSNGAVWSPKPMRVWTGAAWVQKPLKRWSGSAWV